MKPDKNNIGKKCKIHANGSVHGFTVRPSGLVIIGIDRNDYLVEGFIGSCFHKGSGSGVTHGRIGTELNCWWVSPKDLNIGDIDYEESEPTLFNIDEL